MVKVLKNTYLASVYFFLYIPIFVLIFYSFNSSKYSTIWKGFSFKWYEKLISNSMLIEGAMNSLIIATLSATVATIIGTLAAIAFYKYIFLGRKALYFLVYVVMMSPDIVMGVSLLTLFMLMHLEMGFLTLLIAHITFCIPFVVITVYSNLNNFDKHIIEASKDLGATESKTFLFVLLPILMPAIVVGWLLSFTLSLDDFIISFFVTGPAFETLPIKIYSMVRLGVKPEVNALCAILFVLTCVIVFISNRLLKEKEL
jgi:spermidine/putrescine transport system permease protein